MGQSKNFEQRDKFTIDMSKVSGISIEHNDSKTVLHVTWRTGRSNDYDLSACNIELIDSRPQQLNLPLSID